MACLISNISRSSFLIRSNHRLKTLLCNNLASTQSSLRSSQSCLQSRWSSAPSSTTPRANTSASNNPSSKDLAQRVRTCMRQVPHPIVVVTASAPKSGTSNVQISKQEPNSAQSMTDFKNSFAVTLSSFTTVTLGPPTIVTFNLRKPSRTLDAIFNTEGFRIHIMSGTRWGKSIASTMVESQHGDALSRVRLELELDPQSAPHSNIENKPLQSSKHSEGESSNIHLVPLITGPGILAQMECKVTKSIDIGDHTVLFAEVLDLTETMAQDQKTGANHLPNHDRVALLYYEGDYAAAEKHEHSRVLA